MQFRIFVPDVRRIPDELVVGLAERANKRLGRPLENGIGTEDLLDQAALEGLIEPVPIGGSIEGMHCMYFTRGKLVQLARRQRRRLPELERKEP